jgi:hypothetical protein
MRLSVLVAVLIVIAAGLHAQDGVDPSKPQISLPQILIQGVVLDKDSREPVPGARVSTTAMPGSSPGSILVSGGATSGASGEFQMRLNQSSNLILMAQAPHYQGGTALVRGITADQSSVFVEIPLVRLQSLDGVLVDDATRKPIPGLAVELIGNSADPMGLGALPRGTKTVSGPDGRFSFPELPRDEYFLRISDGPALSIGEIPAKQLEGDGRDKALEPPEGALSYGTIVYPGRNADVPSEPGITLGATPVDLGEIRLTRSKLQSLSGLVAPCEEGASIQINLSRPSAQAVLGLLTTRDITCGDGFQLLNLPDGTLTLTAIQGFPQRRWVSQSIDAHTRSPVRLTLNAFVSVQIGVEVEGATTEPLPENLRFTLTPENRAVKVDSPAMLRPGAFEATLYPGERYRLSAQVGPKYYVKRATYNGSTLPDVFGFTASTAPISLLAVVLSDKAAAIEVDLTSGGKPLKDRPQVILLRDGMSFAEFNPNSLRNMRPANSSGTLSFGGLAPGTYRAAIASPDRPLPTTEALFQAMLADVSRQSPPVTVDEGQTATITWDLP